MLLLSTFFFFYFAGVGVYIVFLPKILSSIGYTPMQIGIIFSIVPLMRFLTPSVFLKIFELSKRTYIFSIFVSLACVVSMFFTIDNFYLFFVNIAIFGISNGFIMPYVDAIALEKLKDNYGKSRLWGSIGFMITSLVLAKIYNGYQSGLYFYLILATCIFLVSFLISKNSKSFNFSKDTQDNFSIKNHLGYWVSIFLLQVSFGFFYNFFTIYESSHGISLQMVSYLWSVSIVFEVAMFLIVKKILHIQMVKLIKFSILITIIRWLLLYLFPSSLYISFISQTFHAFSFALFHTATITYLFELYSHKKLSMQFYHGISYGLGGFVGSLLAGYFYGKYLFLVAAIVAIFSLIFITIDCKKIKN